MAKFCGKCGQRLDENTGLCPVCEPKPLPKKKMKKSVKAVIALVCSISIIAVGIFGVLRFLNKNGDLPTYSEYNSFTEGFTDVLVTDEESAIEAIASVGDLLGIKNAEKELKVSKVDKVDTDTFYRVQQYYNDIPVYGRTVALSADKDGKATALTANTFELSNVNLEKILTENEAIDIVKKEFDSDVIVSSPQPVIFSLSENNENFCLAYSLNATSEYNFCEYIISAQDGEILTTESNIFYARTSASGTDKNEENRNFYCEQAEDVYYLEDTEKNIHIYDAKGKNVRGYVNDTKDGVVVSYESDSSSTIFSWFATGEKVQNKKNEWNDEEAVSLMANLSQSYDFYYKYYQREGFDNKNGEILAIINDYMDGKVKNSYSLAAPNYKNTVISMGDYCTINLDLVAHEYTHSVVGSIVDLVGEGETGAINEAYADIMGELIEIDYASSKGKTVESESFWIFNYGARNMISPTDKQFPNYYKGEHWVNTGNTNDDRGGVHTNSTVISHAAYLMCNGIDGSENRKINTEKLSKLWYKSMMFLQTDSDFSQCRNSVELAARIMLKNGELTDEQYNTVVTAFETVGIENAFFTFSKTVKNEFNLSVVADENEKVYFNLEILYSNGKTHIFYDIHDDKALTLENGNYVLRISDSSNPDNVIWVKLRVDGDNENAADEVVINTDFSTVLIIALDETSSQSNVSSTAKTVYTAEDLSSKSLSEIINIMQGDFEVEAFGDKLVYYTSPSVYIYNYDILPGFVFYIDEANMDYDYDNESTSLDKIKRNIKSGKYQEITFIALFDNASLDGTVSANMRYNDLRNLLGEIASTHMASGWFVQNINENCTLLYDLPDDDLYDAALEDVISNGKVDSNRLKSANPKLNAIIVFPGFTSDYNIADTQEKANTSQETNLTQEEKAIAQYQNAAEKTMQSGAWKEKLSMSVDMKMTNGGSETKTSLTLNADMDVSDYKDNQPDNVKITGSANMKLLGQQYAWDMRYEKGVAYYDYTQPYETSTQMEMEPSYFNFNGFSAENIENAKISGNEISFKIPEDKMSDAGISATNLLSGTANIKYNDVDVVVTINKTTGKIDKIKMKFQATLNYQGYNTKAKYNIEYSFT